MQTFTGTLRLRSALRPALLTLLLLSLSTLACAGGAFAGQDSQNSANDRHSYSLASIRGNYAVVGTYTGHVATVLGVLTFDGHGAFTGSAVANQPGPNGSRTVVNVTVAGTYSVEGDGTGTMSVHVTLPNGTESDTTEDFVITEAESRNRTLLATSIFDAQEQPSVIISGDVFVTHTYTRRPD